MIDIANPEDGLLEYEEEMTAYLREREQMFVVSASFLDQGSVTAEHRAVLVDWLLQVRVALVVCRIKWASPKDLVAPSLIGRNIRAQLVHLKLS